MKAKIRHEQYISKSQILIPFMGIILSLIILSLVTTIFFTYVLVFPIIAFLGILIVKSISYYQFSPNGLQYQNKIYNLITERIRNCQTIIDVGCGSGYLTIEIAKSNKDTKVMGVDNWEKRLGYRKKQCMINSKGEGVLNTDYFNYTGTGIELENGTVDCVVSCLAFHKIKNAAKRKKMIDESLRILKTGGLFIFIDLFDSRLYYSSFSRIEMMFKNRNCVIDENKKLSELIELPFPLKSVVILKNACLLSGIKIDD